MIFSSLVPLLSALAFTLGLVAFLSRFLRRFTPAGSGTRPGSVEVVGRTNVAPRQGVATIRVEGRLMLVSFGEGGVRHLADVEPAPEGAEETPEARPSETEGFARAPALLRRKLGQLRLLGLAVVACTTLGVAPLSAQTAQPTPPASSQAQPAAQGTAQAAVDPSTVGTIVSGLTGAGSPQVGLSLGDEEGGLQVSGTVGTVVFIGFMAMLPTLLLLTTSFTRILIVLHLLKQALGTQTAPPAHLLAAMSLLLTGFVMAPTFTQVHEQALTPWMDGEMDEVQMLETAAGPMREFMLGTTREQDLAAFLDMREAPRPETVDEIPFVVVMSAFVTSELTHAFQMAFALFLPFVVIDIVVASVLMSMGMFMLPPVMVSLPFKLLLFVLVDGWALIVSSLVQSF